MRIARFTIADQIAFGTVSGGASDNSSDNTGADIESLTITAIDGHPFGPFEPTAASFPLGDVRLLPPVLPNKVIGIGKNYRDHAAEMGGDPPSTPVMFLKPSTSVIGPHEAIVLPTQSDQVEFEGEIAVVIGRLARDVPPERVSDVILGYTCGNDVTARDLQRNDGQWTRAKGFDSFCPLGPWVETELNAAELAVITTVNGEVRQQSSASEMVHSVVDLVVFVSSVMTLLPGDVVLTGTPAGVGPLQPGDDVAVSVEGVGTLTNRAIAPVD